MLHRFLIHYDEVFRKTLITNRYNTAGEQLQSTFDEPIPILTSVVSVNLMRKDQELKFAAQAFVPPNGKGFDNWPKGF
jgi:hypothetical protein